MNSNSNLKTASQKIKYNWNKQNKQKKSKSLFNQVHIFFFSSTKLKTVQLCSDELKGSGGGEHSPSRTSRELASVRRRSSILMSFSMFKQQRRAAPHAPWGPGPSGPSHLSQRIKQTWVPQRLKKKRSQVFSVRQRCAADVNPDVWDGNAPAVWRSMCHPEPELLSERERSGDGPSPCPPPSALLRSAAVLVPGVRRDPPPRAAAPGVCLKSNQISTLGGFKMQVTSYSTQMKKKAHYYLKLSCPAAALRSDLPSSAFGGF